MPDPADIADTSVSAFIESSIEAAKRPAGPFAQLKPIGICHWCHEPVAAGRLHCRPVDDACAEDHAKRLRQLGRGA